MAKIAELIVSMGVDSGQLRSGFAKAEKSSKQFQRDIRKVAKSAAAVGVAGAAAFTALAVAQTKTIDELGKTAEKLGDTTENLSRLALAADRTGVAQNKLNTGLQRMTRRLADAVANGGPLADTIEELGLDLADLAAQSPSEAFKQIADRISEIEDPARKVSLAFKLFDSEGVDLVRTLNLGREGIEEFEREADRLGKTIRTDTAQSAAQLSDNMERVRDAVTGVANRVLDELLPTLVDLTGDLGENETAFSSLDGVIATVEGTLKGLIATGAAVGGVFSALGNQIGGTTAAIGQALSGDLEGALKTYRQVSADTEEILKGTGQSILDLFKNTVKDVKETTKALDDEQKKQQRILENALENRERIQTREREAESRKGPSEAVRRQRAAIEQLQQQVIATREQIATAELGEAATLEYALAQGTLADTVAEAGARGRELADELVRLTREQEALRTATEESRAEEQRLTALHIQRRELLTGLSSDVLTYQKTVMDLNDLLQAGRISQDEYNGALRRAQDELQKTRDTAETSLISVEEFGKRAAQNLQDIFRDLLFDPFADGLDGMVVKFGQALRAIAAEAVAAQIGKALFGSSGSGGGSGGLFAAGADFLGDFFGGGRQFGGPVSAGRIFQVNESGPEFFAPAGSGEVIPLADMPDMGGITVNNAITVQAPEGRISSATEQQIFTRVGLSTRDALRRAGAF